MPRKEKRSKGGQPGNQNARKHGFYSRALDEAEALHLEDAAEVEGLDEEIAVLRIRLRRLLEECPERLDLQLDAANTITRMVRTRYQISQDQRKSLKDAIGKVLEEVAAPLGVGVGMTIGAKVTGR